MLVFLSLLVACTSDEEHDHDHDTHDDHDTDMVEERDYSDYNAFDEANMANQLARLDAHSQMVTLRKAATLADNADVFGQIRDLYDANDLSKKVAGRGDDHIEQFGYGVEDVGVFLDAHI